MGRRSACSMTRTTLSFLVLDRASTRTISSSSSTGNSPRSAAPSSWTMRGSVKGEPCDPRRRIMRSGWSSSDLMHSSTTASTAPSSTPSTAITGSLCATAAVSWSANHPAAPLSTVSCNVSYIGGTITRLICSLVAKHRRRRERSGMANERLANAVPHAAPTAEHGGILSPLPDAHRPVQRTSLRRYNNFCDVAHIMTQNHFARYKFLCVQRLLKRLRRLAA